MRCDYSFTNYKCSMNIDIKKVRIRCIKCKDYFCRSHAIEYPKLIDYLKGSGKSGDGKYICYKCLLSIVSPNKDSIIRRLKRFIGNNKREDICPLINYDAFRDEIKDNTLRLALAKEFPASSFLIYMREYVTLLSNSYELESAFDWTLNEFLLALEETANYFRTNENLIFRGIRNINIGNIPSKIGMLGEGFSIITFALSGGKVPAANILIKEVTGKGIAELLCDTVKDKIPWNIQRSLATNFAIKCLESLYSNHSRKKS